MTQCDLKFVFLYFNGTFVVCHLNKNGTCWSTGNDQYGFYSCSLQTLEQSNLFMFEKMESQSDGQDECDEEADFE